MNRSESINELATALAKAQSELRNPAFDSTNPHFRSKFASLAAVRDAVIPVFAKHGLSVTQWPHSEGSISGCVTMLAHSSGQFMEQAFLIPVDKATAQGHASALTYSRRLSLQSIAGVVGEEDDDGNVAAGSKPDPVKQMHAADIKPMAGAGENLPPEKREWLERKAQEVGELLDNGRDSEAVQACAFITDNDEKIYLWSKLASKYRSKLKSLTKQAKEAA